MSAVLTRFKRIAARHESPQERAFDWLAAAHVAAEKSRRGSAQAFDLEGFQARMRKSLARFGCGPERISKRGHELDDFLHLDWRKMRLFNLEKNPEGADIGERTRFQEECTDRVFDELYSETDTAPDDIVHATCTAYAAPSSAQKLASRRGWGRRTTVTHAYHMGCMAAFPAVRMAAGFLACSARKRRADIVHTELCTLHLNPGDHSPEQLVVQTLFADGMIAYSALPREEFARLGLPGLEILALEEQILPDSIDSMGWRPSSWGMRMNLSRDVPVRIGKAIGGFLGELLRKASLDLSKEKGAAVFAVHPGGPKVLDFAQAGIGLDDAQLFASRKVLFERGNMSSATIPHIWREIVDAPDIGMGALVISVAFGPGLTVGGAVMRKV